MTTMLADVIPSRAPTPVYRATSPTAIPTTETYPIVPIPPTPLRALWTFMDIFLAVPERSFRTDEETARGYISNDHWPFKQFHAILGDSWPSLLVPFRVMDTILRFPTEYDVGMLMGKPFTLRAATGEIAVLQTWALDSDKAMTMNDACVQLARDAAAHLAVARCMWQTRRPLHPVPFVTANWALMYNPGSARWVLTYSAP